MRFFAVFVVAVAAGIPAAGQIPAPPASKGAVEETSDRGGRGASDGVFERGVKPTLDRVEPVEKLRMAESLGLPWIAWVQYNPAVSKEAALMFEELTEAKHVYIETDYVIGRGMGPRIVFRGKDGGFLWMKAGNCVQANAARVRQAWMGEVAPGSMRYAERAVTVSPSINYTMSPANYTMSQAMYAPSMSYSAPMMYSAPARMAPRPLFPRLAAARMERAVGRSVMYGGAGACSSGG